MNNNIQDIAECILQNSEINTEEEFEIFFNQLKTYMLHLYSDEFHNDIDDPYIQCAEVSDSETDDDTVSENSIGSILKNGERKLIYKEDELDEYESD